MIQLREIIGKFDIIELYALNETLVKALFLEKIRLEHPYEKFIKFFCFLDYLFRLYIAASSFLNSNIQCTRQKNFNTFPVDMLSSGGMFIKFKYCK